MYNLFSAHVYSGIFVSNRCFIRIFDSLKMLIRKQSLKLVQATKKGQLSLHNFPSLTDILMTMADKGRHCVKTVRIRSYSGPIS